MSGTEFPLVQQAFEDNWIAPAGPHLAAFEREFCAYTGARHAVALSSGTAAIHLALLTTGVQANDEIVVSTLTFSGSVNPIMYMGARPVFIDSDVHSWNLDPALLAQFLADRAKQNRLPKAVLVVHLYGQAADMDAINAICAQHGVMVIEDAAEALGTYYKNRHAGTLSRVGTFSFNGNKIITTSGGGMFVSDDRALVDHARKLASQAREPVPHYEHTEVGFNYRMSNVLAAIGSGQLSVIEDRVRRKREIYDRYVAELSSVPGLTFVNDMPYGRHTHWLSVMLVDAPVFGTDREHIRLALEALDIESRPLWKPMHLQPVFQGCEVIGGAVAEQLFDQGLCLPSGTAMDDSQIDRISAAVRELARS
jgi:dTDP-4-amino-4,6-dideoxygalactose transaminase